MTAAFTAVQWTVLAAGAAMFGVSKTGIPGVGMLGIPLVAAVIPAKASTGIILPMLIFADFFAIAFYRRHVVWKTVLRLLPWAVAGIVAGYFALGRVNDAQLKPFIGGVILAMLALNFWKDRRPGLAEAVPGKWWFAAVLGVLAGVTTMMANAAGSILVIYLLAMRLPKDQFIGTGAWYFFILNWFKVPFSANLGLITLETLRLNALLFPAVAAGALGGVLIQRRIPEKGFAAAVQILTVVAAVRLLLP